MTDSRIDGGPERAFHLSRWCAAVPLLTFIAMLILFSFRGQVDVQIMAGLGVSALVLGSLLARDKPHYWQSILRGIGHQTTSTMTMLFLLVGVLVALMNAGGLRDGVLWLSHQIGVTGPTYMLVAFVASALVAVAISQTYGAILMMLPTLYPSGVALGLAPAMLVGAIISGAACGQHFAPFGDTSVISSTTQRFRYRDGHADIGGVVRARVPYVLIAFVIAAAAHMMMGGTAVTAAAVGQGGDPLGLVMLLPVGLIIALALVSKSPLQTLAYGIMATVLTGLAFGRFGIAALFPGKAESGAKTLGALTDGAISQLPVIAMVALVMATYQLLQDNGLLDALTGRLARVAGQVPARIELTLFGLFTLLSLLFVGNASKVTVIGGPIANAVGGRGDSPIHPYRRANLLNGVADGVSYFVPWHVWPIGVAGAVAALGSNLAPGYVPPTATAIAAGTFYPMAIWLVMLIAAATGFMRRFETPDGVSTSAAMPIGAAVIEKQDLARAQQ